MTEVLNDYFFPVKNFNNEEMISLLEKYMFTTKLNINKEYLKQETQEKKETVINDNTKENNYCSLQNVDNTPSNIISNIENNKIVSTKKEKENEKIKDVPKQNKLQIPNKINNNMIIPNKTDSLFWCVYIAVYGYDEYNTIINHYYNKEMEERQKIIDYLKKNPSIIKNSNIKITKIAFQEMLSDLMVNKKITLNLLILLCIYYNINIFIVNDYTYVEFSVINEILDKPTYIIYKNKNKEYAIDLDFSMEKINNIKNNYFKIENFIKPLKSISNYSIHELKQILKSFNLKDEITNNLKLKTDIYNIICEHCLKDL